MKSSVSRCRSSNVSRARCAGALSCWKTYISPSIWRMAGRSLETGERSGNTTRLLGHMDRRTRDPYKPTWRQPQRPWWTCWRSVAYAGGVQRQSRVSFCQSVHRRGRSAGWSVTQPWRLFRRRRIWSPLRQLEIFAATDVTERDARRSLRHFSPRFLCAMRLTDDLCILVSLAIWRVVRWVCGLTEN